MSIWGCGSPASYCQSSAASCFIYLESSWMHVPFVLSSIQPYLPFAIAVFFFFNCSSCWEVPLAPSPMELSSRQPQLQAFPSPRLLGRCCHSCLLWPVCLFRFTWRIAPPPLSRAQGAPPSLLHVLFFSAACLLFSLFFSLFFSWVVVSLSRGLCWSGPGLSVGVPHTT
jgi:hypothetical protein